MKSIILKSVFSLSLIVTLVTLFFYYDKQSNDPVTNNMNGSYKIANAHPNGKFSSDFSKDGAKYFDVYSPNITSRYGEVVWRALEAVPIPSDIVQQFKDKTMAVVGWEYDQVQRSQNAEDVSIPIYDQYNHHLFVYVMSDASEMKVQRVQHNIFHPDDSKKHNKIHAQMNHGQKEFLMGQQKPNDPKKGISDIPAQIFFFEGSGGEFRKTFKGFQKNQASLIDSPSYLSFQVMQIDTKNRDNKKGGFELGPIPKNSKAPENAHYSPLIECPCTDRIKKEFKTNYITQNQGKCSTPIKNASECQAAVNKKAIPSTANFSVVSDPNLPSGCSIDTKNNTYNIYFNTIEEGSDCSGSDVSGGSTTIVGNKIDIQFDKSKELFTITMEGPDKVWFGLGLGAQKMADEPYTYIVDGAGKVSFRKLGDHTPGAELPFSGTVLENTVKDGRRTVQIALYSPGTPQMQTFPVISAFGTGSDFGYHSQRGSDIIKMVAKDSVTCVCNGGVAGYINGQLFERNCRPEPYGDLLQQKNPTCWAETYRGGLECCKDHTILLDQDQNPWVDQTMTYNMKLRVWYKEATPEIKNQIRANWVTEQGSNEYDIPQCEAGTPPQDCIHSIQSHFQVKDMLHECPLRSNPMCGGNFTGHKGINLTFAAPHCHAPSCLSMELYNADTGKLICRSEPVYGQSENIFDEQNYLSIPPCMWGTEEEGLASPMFLSFDSNLTSVKRSNSTLGHTGDMAYWITRSHLA